MKEAIVVCTRRAQCKKVLDRETALDNVESSLCVESNIPRQPWEQLHRIFRTGEGVRLRAGGLFDVLLAHFELSKRRIQGHTLFAKSVVD